MIFILGKSRDEPAPVKLDKPLAQSTPDYSRSNTQSKPPSQSANTTPTKHTAQPLIKDTGKKGKDFCLPTATLPLNKEVMVRFRKKCAIHETMKVQGSKLTFVVLNILCTTSFSIFILLACNIPVRPNKKCLCLG